MAYSFSWHTESTSARHAKGESDLTPLDEEFEHHLSVGNGYKLIISGYKYHDGWHAGIRLGAPSHKSIAHISKGRPTKQEAVRDVLKSANADYERRQKEADAVLESVDIWKDVFDVGSVL